MFVFLGVFISLIIALGNAALNPYPHMREAEDEALSRGIPRPLIILTRCTQFYTLYSQVWFLLALWSGAAWVIRIAFILNLSVSILYYGFIWWDYKLLCYPSVWHIAQFSTGILPPWDMKPIHKIAWFGLHLQHGFAPFYLLWLGVPPRTSTLEVFRPLGALIIFVSWNTFCWGIQGIPAYPIQEKLGGEYWPSVTLGGIAMLIMTHFLT